MKSQKAQALSAGAGGSMPTSTARSSAKFQVVRRAGEYAIAKPARELLFSVLDRERKYKAKNFIDTVVFRGSETASGWLLAGLQALGLTVAALAAAAIPLALAWLALSWTLGRRQQALARQNPA